MQKSKIFRKNVEVGKWFQFIHGLVERKKKGTQYSMSSVVKENKNYL